jgi:hypothetical protein
LKSWTNLIGVSHWFNRVYQCFDLPNDNIDEYNSGDDSALDPIPKGEGEDHDDGKDEGQAVRDLPQKNLKYRDLLAILQAIGAVCGQATCRFIVSETIPECMSIPMMQRSLEM